MNPLFLGQCNRSHSSECASDDDDHRWSQKYQLTDKFYRCLSHPHSKNNNTSISSTDQTICSLFPSRSTTVSKCMVGLQVRSSFSPEADFTVDGLQHDSNNIIFYPIHRPSTSQWRTDSPVKRQAGGQTQWLLPLLLLLVLATKWSHSTPAHIATATESIDRNCGG